MTAAGGGAAPAAKEQPAVEKKEVPDKVAEKPVQREIPTVPPPGQ